MPWGGGRNSVVRLGSWGVSVSLRMYWLLMMVDGDADDDGRVHSIGAGDAVAGPKLSHVAELVLSKHSKPTWTPHSVGLFFNK